MVKWFLDWAGHSGLFGGGGAKHSKVVCLFVSFFETWSYSGSSSWPRFQLVAQAAFKITAMLLAQLPVYGVIVMSHHAWCDFFSILIYWFCCVHMGTTVHIWRTEDSSFQPPCGTQGCQACGQLLYPLSNLFGPRILRVWNESRAESGRCATVVQSDIHDRFKITDWGHSLRYEDTYSKLDKARKWLSTGGSGKKWRPAKNTTLILTQ